MKNRIIQNGLMSSLGVFLLLAALPSGASAFGPKKPEAPVPYPGEEETQRRETRPSWDPSLFTDPKAHNPDHFIYIVSEMDPDSHWTMDTFKDPSVVQKNYRICTSVIRNDFIRTFTGQIAFILSVPKENVGPMYWDDMATGVPDDYNGAITLFFPLFRGRFGVMYTPNSLVDATRDQSPGYNEVDVLGTNESQSPYSKVSINGFIAQCGSDWESLMNGKESELDHAGPDSLLDRCLSGYHHSDQVQALHQLQAKYPVILMKKM
jgi:hypothetical protein